MRSMLTCVFFALTLSLAAAPVAAQVVAQTFEQLQSGVRTGDRLFVIDSRGVETKGRLQNLSPDLLTITSKATGERKFTMDDVIAVKKKQQDSVWNGAAIGAGVFGALSLLNFATCRSCDTGRLLGNVVDSVVAGAGIGALIDATILTPQDVYRRGPATRVRLEPQVGRDRVSATMTLRW